MALSLQGRGASILNRASPSLALKSTEVKVNNAVVGYTYEATDNADNKKAVQDFIGRQLNIDVLANREKSLIEAMAHPDTWQENRQKHYETMKADLSKFYTDQLAKYYTAGYSMEQAQKMAEDSANRMLPIHLQDIEILQPGSSTLFANAAFKVDSRNTNFKLYSGAAEGGPDRKAIYKEEKARRKAKRGKTKQITA